MKTIVVIVAAGSGSRMGGNMPKQFLDLLGKPVLLHSVDAFLTALPDCQVIVVAHPSFMEATKKLVNAYTPAIQVVEGGASRSESVKSALLSVPDDAIVMIHDAARCVVTTALIRSCHSSAVDKGTAIPVVAITDSLRTVSATGTKPLDRAAIRAVQTPQAFQATILKTAYNSFPSEEFTDDATVVERNGVTLQLIEGEPTNIKITRPMDLAIAGQLMQFLLASTT